MLCLTLLLAGSALNSLSFPPTERFTLIKARPEVEAELVWDRTDALGHGLTGKGVTICDIDAPPDIFHPMFFKADRGRFDWIDMDGDGHWSPGDAVDIDGNGLAGPDETLGWLPYEGEGPPGRDPTRFQAGYDFLYQDVNGNSKRDFGLPAFTESDPCYGEGIFLVDDVDGNEQLDVTESLVGLKTSKFRAIGGFGRVHRRGVDLIEAGRYGDDHGTLVCCVLAGGWPGLHHLTGIAPDAELISITGNLQFARDEGADVVLFEFDQGLSDGSSDLDLEVNELAKAGICVVTPAGNDRAPGRHVVFSDSQSVTLTNRDPRPLDLQFVWTGAGPSLIRVAPPGASPCDLPIECGLVEEACVQGALNLYETPRKTSFLYVRVLTTTNRGDWTFSFSGSSGAIHGFVFYDFEDPGAEWIGGDGGYTVTSPGTADSAITVAAYENYLPGDVAWFSGEGPRLDGRPAVDIAAPGVGVFSALGGGANFAIFSGTSAAIPFVAAGAALLRQAFPGLDSGRLRSLLENGAARDSLTESTNRWGAGRLRINESLLYGLEHPVVAGADLAVSVSPNPARSPMEISWASNGDAGAEVRIFSVQGALVWETRPGPSADTFRVLWTRVDREGRKVPAGVYFVHVKQDKRVGVTRCVLVE